jgi:hypothetical protein
MSIHCIASVLDEGNGGKVEPWPARVRSPGGATSGRDLQNRS